MTSSSPREILLTSSPDSPIVAYDTSTGAILAHFSGSRSPRKGLALSGNTFIAASHISSHTNSGSIHLYNWCSSTSFHHFSIPEPVAPLITTLDGSYLFAGGISGHIHALSLPSRVLLRSFPAHSKPVSCLTINNDGSLLISGGDDGTIRVFPILHLLDTSSDDNSNPITLYKFSGHTLSVTTITSGSGGCNSTIISSSLDCTCKIWSLSHGVLIRTVAFPCMIWAVVVDPTETEFYAGGSDGRIYVGILKVSKRQDVNNGSEVATWGLGHGGAVTAMAMANEGLNLISASEDGCIYIWDVGRGEIIRVIEHESGNISDIVVEKGIRNGGGYREKYKSEGIIESSQSLGFSGREISRPVKEVREMEEMLSVVVKDRRRAINTLEVAIGTYGRLLELILKEGEKEDKEGNYNKKDEDNSIL